LFNRGKKKENEEKIFLLRAVEKKFFVQLKNFLSSFTVG
jgi:hypothetical protein